ncbi:MAG: hypothetical protein LC803_16745 [Acidobacteria bacterium]|nr:hypothetical protein [Acidobacteriota bacterium]
MLSDRELETLDEAIAEIDLQLAGAHHHSLALGDRREGLLAGRAELRRRRERAGLFEVGALVNFYSIDYVGTVAEYFDPDPNLMRGDGMRQVWPPGGLERITRAQARR